MADETTYAAEDVALVRALVNAVLGWAEAEEGHEGLSRYGEVARLEHALLDRLALLARERDEHARRRSVLGAEFLVRGGRMGDAAEHLRRIEGHCDAAIASLDDVATLRRLPGLVATRARQALHALRNDTPADAT